MNLYLNFRLTSCQSLYIAYAYHSFILYIAYWILLVDSVKTVVGGKWMFGFKTPGVPSWTVDPKT